MLQKELIKEFLDKKRIAVVGVSRKGDIPANAIFRRFKEAGYIVYPVNPNTNEVEGEKCFRDISSISEKPEAVMLASTPSVSVTVIQDCVKNNIPIIWMHKGIGNGSFSLQAETVANENGIKVINNGCPLMFVEKVDGFHKVLKWFK